MGYVKRNFINQSAKPTPYLFTITSYFLLAHPLQDEHRISEGEKPVALLHGLTVSGHDGFVACEGGNQHDQGAFRQMKVGDQAVDYVKLIAGLDKNIGVSFARTNPSVLSVCSL